MCVALVPAPDAAWQCACKTSRRCCCHDPCLPLPPCPPQDRLKLEQASSLQHCLAQYQTKACVRVFEDGTGTLLARLLHSKTYICVAARGRNYVYASKLTHEVIKMQLLEAPVWDNTCRDDPGMQAKQEHVKVRSPFTTDARC